MLGFYRFSSSEHAGYRFGFNGMEKDDEVKGNGNSINYKFRMHDPRIGRFFSVDPIAHEFAYNSPYAFSENRVIDAIELEGLEAVRLEQMIGNQVAPKIGLSTNEYTELTRPSLDRQVLINGGSAIANGIGDGLEAADRFNTRIKGNTMHEMEGPDGLKTLGIPIMLGTAGAIVSGGSLLFAEVGVIETILTSGSLLSSFDGMTTSEDQTTLAGRLSGDQETVDGIKLGLSVASFGLGTKSLVEQTANGQTENFIINFSNVINDEVNAIGGLINAVEKKNEENQANE